MIKIIIFFIILNNFINLLNCQHIDFGLPKLLGEFDEGISFFPLFENKGEILKLHIRCYSNKINNNGEILLFDSGLPLYSTSYGNVIELLIKNNTMRNLNISNACFFDRYGYGWSDISKNSMTSKQFLKRLFHSIRQVPLIQDQSIYYVGWSYGGLLAQTFAMLYPNQTKGLLLIDSSDIGSIVDPKWSEENITNQVELVINNILPASKKQVKQLTEINYFNITHGWFDNSTNLPKSCIELSQNLFLNNYYKIFLTAINELIEFIPNAISLKNLYCKSINPNQPLGDLPLVVISSNPTEEQDWFKRQIEISKLSSNSIQINSIDHFVPLNQPQLIINSIELLLNLKKN